jgi:vacuolar protein sorting-associated protein 13A/C
MVSQGAASFVKKTVFGFSDSVTKFTSSVGKGQSPPLLWRVLCLDWS